MMILPSRLLAASMMSFMLSDSSSDASHPCYPWQPDSCPRGRDEAEKFLAWDCEIIDVEVVRQAYFCSVSRVAVTLLSFAGTVDNW